MIMWIHKTGHEEYRRKMKRGKRIKKKCKQGE
jgi:hypothetical protein